MYRRATQMEQDKGTEHSQRNVDCCDNRGTQITEKEQQDEKDQYHSQQQILEDGTKRGIDQSGAVIVRYYLIALRQHSCCIELVDLLPHPLQRLEGVAVLAHQDGAGDDLILIVHSDDPEPRRPSNRNITHITNPDWRGLVAGEHDVANVVEGMDKTYSTHIKSLLTDVKVAAARVGV